jgi:hypothetical protein
VGPKDAAPFHVWPDDMEKIRELVEVLQHHLPPVSRPALVF